MCHYSEITEVEEQSKMLWETINSLDRQLKTFLVLYLLQYAWSLKCICGGALYKTFNYYFAQKRVCLLPRAHIAQTHHRTQKAKTCKSVLTAQPVCNSLSVLPNTSVFPMCYHGIAYNNNIACYLMHSLNIISAYLKLIMCVIRWCY